MLLSIRTSVALAAALLPAFVTRTACAQVTPIFIDDFENGTDDTAISTAKWGTRNSSGGTVAAGTEPNYQTETNPFPSGTLYARIFDNDASGATAVAPRMISSDDDLTPSFGVDLTGKVTTFSFMFVETSAQPATNGISVGYTNSDDLNAAERQWRAFARNGTLTADNINEGANAPYTLDKVHTLWMMANDSTTPVENYAGGQTIEPGNADVWISIEGADPIFTFSLNKQNAATAPIGFGFRSFSGDAGELLVDNVLVMPGATFDRTAFNAPPGPNANFDELGTVDAADLTKWRTGFPKATAAVHMDGDANADGDVDGNDFLAWQQQLGTTPTAGAALAAVPEPATIALATVALATSLRRHRYQPHRRGRQ